LKLQQVLTTPEANKAVDTVSEKISRYMLRNSRITALVELSPKEIEDRENTHARLYNSKIAEADQGLKQEDIRKIFPANHVDFLDRIKRKWVNPDEDEDDENQAVAPIHNNISAENLLSSSETLDEKFEGMIPGITDS
ncbi:hypothetical protein BX616_008318, partial [Lobosporangium transversale]